MPSFNPDAIIQAARLRGFRPEAFEAAVRLLAYLDEVRTHPDLAGKLALRGGTAINLFLDDAPRMSIDADLNYVGSVTREGMTEEQAGVMAALQEVGEQQGYEIRDPQRTYAEKFFFLSYSGVLKARKSIKVEVNFLLRAPLLPPDRRKAAPIFGGVDCAFLISHPEEVYAGKLKALIQRAAPRDLFDVHRLAAHPEPLSGLRRKLATVFIATVDDDPRDLTIESLPWPDDRALKQELHPYVRGGLTLSMKDLRSRIDPVVRSLLAFDASQRSFLDALMSGNIEGRLLFPDDAAVAAQIDALPALHWKVRNLGRVRKRRTGGSGAGIAVRMDTHPPSDTGRPGAAPSPADVTALVLAGGQGTRLRTVLGDRQKVLAGVGGRPFIGLLLDQLAAAGVRKAVLCVGHRAADVRAILGEARGALRLAYSEEPAPLGTAGALRHALSLAPSDPLLILNGDSFCDLDLAAMLGAHASRGNAATIALVEVPDTGRYGRVVVDGAGAVTRFEEKAAAAGPGWINAGVYVIRRALIEAVPPGRAVSIERECFPAWIGHGLGGFLSRGRFVDIGTPESLADAERLLADRHPPGASS